MALRQGPLAGVRVVELAGIGPGPMCGMLLADMGAQVLLVERLEPANVGIARPRRYELPHRGKQSLAVDLKHADGVALVADLVAAADVLIEGFRPGTMERLGLGPEACLARHPGLVYGRMTGYGQDGPLNEVAGHDLNYLALSGALHALGPAEGKPAAPLNLLADYAGGALNLAFGIACALVERNRSGLGQVIDASMVEGAAVLMTSMFGMYAAGLHTGPRGHNLLDGGAPHYATYACADGAYIAFAAIEPKFRAVFAERTGLPPQALARLDDPATWPQGRAMLAELFATRRRREWCELLEDTDACVTPVLDRDEAPRHPHNVARGSFVVQDGLTQPAAAPRFSRTPGAVADPPPPRGAGGEATAAAWGIPAARLHGLRATGVIGADSTGS